MKQEHIHILLRLLTLTLKVTINKPEIPKTDDKVKDDNKDKEDNTTDVKEDNKDNNKDKDNNVDPNVGEVTYEENGN